VKALITETKGFRVGPMGHDLVEFDDIVRFQLDATLFLGTAGEPCLVIFADGSWGFHTALEVDELVHQEGFHQAIPMNAIFRDFINYETSKPVIEIKVATPVPEL
jgi:hypothetical protein